MSLNIRFYIYIEEIKMKQILAYEDLREWVLRNPLIGFLLEGRSFIEINGKDYLIKDIEEALVKGKGIVPIK